MSMFGKRILILAPHPDDEIVGFCAAAGRAQQRGAEIFVLFLTHGCVAPEILWPWQRRGHAKQTRLRRAEAEKTAAFLGLKFLGFSDLPARFLWQDLACVRARIKTALETRAIDQLWIPAYEGGHPDHDALNGLCASFKEKTDILEFAEYNYSGRRHNANIFPRLNGNEIFFSLSPQEREKKKKALALYASEKKNLSAIGLERECFRPLASYDYSHPAHEGTLWYGRFWWVPFPHPRVNRVTSLQVCRALSRFAQTNDPPESATR